MYATNPFKEMKPDPYYTGGPLKPDPYYGPSGPPSPNGGPGPNPFVDPPAPWSDDDFYYQNVPEAGWWKQLMNWQPSQEYWGMGNRAQYAQRQFGRYQNMFATEASADPNLQWYTWLQGQKDPGMEYETLGPDARGESNYRSYTPRARWNMGGY